MREQMKESKFFQEVLQEGRLEGRCFALLETLDSRFGSGCVAELAGTVGKLNDPEQLAELQRAATTCRRLADFRRALADVTSRS
jgi:hypothetical protein